jgi:predicted sulfurtransferase
MKQPECWDSGCFLFDIRIEWGLVSETEADWSETLRRWSEKSDGVSETHHLWGETQHCLSERVTNKITRTVKQQE